MVETNIETSATYEVIDPATRQALGEVPLHQLKDLQRAISAAQHAADDWGNNRKLRQNAMRQGAQALGFESTRLGRILSLEQGKPLSEAILEFHVAAELLSYYADLEWDNVEKLPDRHDRSVEIQLGPVGLAGAIIPWNFPISLLAVKLAPALAAGCTLIAKPAPSTPMSSIAFAEVLNRFLPRGVFQVLTGGGTLARMLSEAADVRKISFTGSTEVGAKIMAQAAPTVKRVTLELGGNDPAIVLDDADPEFTAQQVVRSAFRNAGQVCMAVKRVYVPRNLSNDLTEAIVSEASKLVVGHGVDESTTMGPMHTATQQQMVRSLVDEAINDGGQLVLGGGPGTDLPGHFLEPTIVANAPRQTNLVKNEQFGAALPIVTYDNLQETVAGLNSEEFGLGASVWSPDLEKAHRIASQLEVGTAWINQHTVVELDAPFGGWKGSGIGRERGSWGLSEYLEPRTVNSRSHSA